MAISYAKSAESVTRGKELCPSGFTGPEKIALMNAWRLLKTDIKAYSTEISLGFFLKYPHYLKWFKIDESTYNLELLHGHLQMVMKTFEDIIEGGLFDVVKLNVILMNLKKTHNDVGIFTNDLTINANYISAYIKVALSRYMTPSLESALEKMGSKVSEGHGYEDLYYYDELY